MNWQSSRVKPPTLSRATSHASATFDASVAVENMLSPKKARPSLTPYSPPTSTPPCHTSTEWAWPVEWSPSVARSIGSLIHVSSRAAHWRSTSPNAWSMVTVNRPDRTRRASDRDRRNQSIGRIARLRGSTQKTSLASRLSDIGKIPAA